MEYNLDFSIIYSEPVMADACTYCGHPIRSKHIQLTFDYNSNKMRFHLEPDNSCWEQFVLGVKTVNSHLTAGSLN
jgi:hypothetical protein